MTTSVSYGNGNVLRGLNLIGFNLPSSVYKTAFYDVSSFSSFSISAFTDTLGLSISIIESVDGSSFIGSQRTIPLPIITSLNVLEDLGSYPTKSRFLALEIFGTPGTIFSTQCLFQ